MDNERESPIESPLESPVNLDSDEEVNDNEPQPAARVPPTSKPNLTGDLLQGRKRVRKLTSDVWGHFDMIDELDIHGNIQCKCIKCGTKYIAESSHGTGNMRRHIKSCKGKVYRDVGQMILQSNASGIVENKISTFKVDEFRELLALAIARHNLPLQLVEYEGIRAVFSYLCPEVKHVSRHTIKNDVMKIYAKEKSKLNEALKHAPGRVAVRESVKYCKGSQSRRQKFLKCVQHVNLEGSTSRGLRQDVPTRWNSTYTMLESALFFKKALLHMKATDANFVSCPNAEEWARIDKICKFLGVFHEVTLAFSGTKYPTSNLYFPNVVKVRLLLKEHMGSPDRFLKTMATRMWEKFDKYWSEFSTIMAIAVVFDPRFKLQVVEWAYKKLYNDRWEFEMELFKGKLFALYNEYASSTPISMNRQGNTQNGPTHDDLASDTYMEVISSIF
ncbi:hypothetical protein BVRB_7g170450 [Beta vulgaris subsp. vulgaris]|nr:hypothetical protein BVRB_7g170450 [Beta vulgaris subsp. vulgaris]